MEASSEPRWWTLPRRDWLLLPLIAILTPPVLLLPAELIVRHQHPAELIDACIAKSDHGKPDCVSYTKTVEGPWVTNRYNECGYRTAESCGPRPAGSLRVAVIGSSTAEGYLVPYQDTLSARAASTLTIHCGKPVQFQNLAAYGNLGEKVVASAKEALSLDPDAIVLPVAPFDFEPSGAGVKIGEEPAPSRNLLRRLRERVSASTLLYMETYYLLHKDTSYLPVYLGLGHGADFMREPMPLAWRKQVDAFDNTLGQIADMARARSVPVLLIFIPQRAEAVLATSLQDYPDFHPRDFPNLLAGIAGKHGVSFADMTAFIPSNTPTADLFYPENGHINAGGHALAARAITHAIEGDPMPSFAQKCRSPQPSAKLPTHTKNAQNSSASNPPPRIKL